ncbi:MAG: hypothetical protein HYT61_01825 [Candidatus Yanofskybacteria bacterium]|nr:hypothetical protein [Candidatus Yanofskybacteria bacterium]
MWYAYIIKSQNNRPLQYIFTKEFNSETEARSYEKKLKDKRIEKEKIIKQIENS